MSIFLTRPVINTEEERNAKADILELIKGRNGSYSGREQTWLYDIFYIHTRHNHDQDYCK